MRRLLSPALLLAAALGGCREGAEPFTVEDRSDVGDATAWQLTFSIFPDRAPAWSAAGDSVYYVTPGAGVLPATPGVLGGLPARGGSFSLVLPAVQGGANTRRWLASPAVSPSGDRLAYAELWTVRPARLYTNTSVICEDGDTTGIVPTLGAVRLRVRAFGAVGPVEQDPEHEVRFEGFRERESGGVALLTTHAYPFHVLFDEERASVFRPSWSPDGTRLVYSDGLRLRIWRVGDASATVVPNTFDDVEPAWSPDGQWIAFTHLERADSARTTCRYVSPLGTAAIQDRTLYTVGERTLTLIRPDGSERTELGRGEEPAWGPGANSLFLRRDASVWRTWLNGRGTVPVPASAGGREPAVSPDGRRLAFSKRNASGDYDLWITSLDDSR